MDYCFIGCIELIRRRHGWDGNHSSTRHLLGLSSLHFGGLWLWPPILLVLQHGLFGGESQKASSVQYFVPESGPFCYVRCFVVDAAPYAFLCSTFSCACNPFCSSMFFYGLRLGVQLWGMWGVVFSFFCGRGFCTLRLYMVFWWTSGCFLFTILEYQWQTVRCCNDVNTITWG